MDLTLIRWCYGEDRTQGCLVGDGIDLHTIERPWVHESDGVVHRGGKPFESCIPDGEYLLLPFERVKTGDDVFCLVNPDLGVYERADEVPEAGGRYACLFHAANWVINPHSGQPEIYGCIAPGLSHTVDDAGNPMVTSSKAAMRILMDALPYGDRHSVTIRPHPGALNKYNGVFP